LEKYVDQAAKRYVKAHHAPLHEIMHAFKILPSKFETIEPCSSSPKDSCTFMVCIPGSKEEAKQQAATDCSEISVFSDGLGHEGSIGAAAVLYRGGTEKWSLWKHMGSEDRHTIFEAELLGLSLAVEILKDERQGWSLTIGVDSQATLHATGHRRAIPGQYLVEAFHEQVAAVQNKHSSIEIILRWTLGHEGITGNEWADEAANREAKGKSSEQSRLPTACRGEMLCSRPAAARITGRGSTKSQGNGLSSHQGVKGYGGSIHRCPH